MSRLILFPTTAEAEKMIDKLHARADPSSIKEIWQEGKVPTLYRYDGGTIVITNIGLHASAAALALHSEGHQEVVHLGWASSLNETLQEGTLIPIARVGKYHGHRVLNGRSKQLTEAGLPEINLRSEGGSLLSSDIPMTGHHLLGSSAYDLIDTEGYAIAHLATALGMGCRIWKWIGARRVHEIDLICLDL